MISKIEQAVVARLRLGLGRMARTVKSYGGEVEDLGQQLTTFPAVWVTYGGSRIEAGNTAKDRYREQAELAAKRPDGKAARISAKWAAMI